MKQQKQLKQSRRYYLQWIWKQYKNHKKMILFLLALTALSTLIAVLFPIVFKYIIDNLVSGLEKFQAGEISLKTAKSERNKMLLMLLAMGLGPVFSGIYPYFRAKMNITFEIYFREKFFGEILAKGHKFFLRYRTGDLVTRLTEDIRTWPPGLSWLCCSGIFRAVNSASIIFFCLATMMYLNWKLALLACIPMPIMLYIFIKLETQFGQSFKDLQTGMSEGNDFLEAAYSGIKIISSFNSQKPQKKLFSDHLQKRIKQEIKVDSLWGVFMMFFEFLNYIGELLVLIFGGLMVIKGELTLGTYYAFFSYLGMIIYPLMDIPMLLVTLTQACVAIDRLEELQAAEREWQENDSEGTFAIDEIRNIELKDICFKHNPLDPGNNEHKPFEFKNLNFGIKRGEKIAVVGKIGSGKTTFLNLIAGMVQPDEGKILVNDKSIDEISKSSFRDKIGYIQQEPTIFSETVHMNIDFWRNNPESLIKSCARLAQFEDEVMAFPSGYSEAVGQRGVTLSGGQRQRLSIARALAGEPELLLMDDITASLDAANEQQLWADLNYKFNSISCIIVTHRLATAMMADRIVVLDNGGIAAIGTHEKLIKECPIYKELAHS
ncbi:MAG: ABC transporter ATP-binding protein [Candidatus Rifleibacteriota bacterium]